MLPSSHGRIGAPPVVSLPSVVAALAVSSPTVVSPPEPLAAVLPSSGDAVEVVAGVLLAVLDPSVAAALPSSPPGHAEAIASRITLARSARRTHRCSHETARALFVHLLGEVELLAEAIHQAELGLEPVGVLFLGFEDVLEHVAAHLVLLGAAKGDAVA
jgi:hypothetical protein